MEFPSTQFSEAQIEKICARFQQYAEDSRLSKENFKKSMGLLGIGEAEILSERIFELITHSETCSFGEFLCFLNSINHGCYEEKARISFNFLDRGEKGYINYQDIQVIISEISFIWNFLTDEKISNSDSIELISQKLGINEQQSIDFNEYLSRYDLHFSWFDYFNNSLHEQVEPKKEFVVDQVEEYLKLVHREIQKMIGDFVLEPSMDTSLMKHHYSTQSLKPKGDTECKGSFIGSEELSESIREQGQSHLQIIVNKLEQLADISDQLFSTETQIKSARHSGRPKNAFQIRKSFIGNEKKAGMLNVTQPSNHRANLVYFGHQNWNLMINMMLGIRRSLKSHFYPQEHGIFTEEDIHCKYMHELIYKKHNKSVKEVCQIFVDYAPKVFSFIRKHFGIDNQQFLKSIGLQNLIGNLLMGNLSTLTDQTSEGKSGSFIYYTEDSKIIVKSVAKEEYKKLKEILEDYVDYVRENSTTLLTHIYGLYKMKNKKSSREIYFIVMKNVFDKQVEIKERYDIKGATFNRHAIKCEEDKLKRNIALKDVDLINNGRQFLLDPEDRKKYFKQICLDAQFLAEHNIIEYSLLIGVTESGECFFGIIDILSEYTAKKVIENHFFHLFNADISCLAPEQYCSRFKNFINDHIFQCD